MKQLYTFKYSYQASFPMWMKKEMIVMDIMW